MKKHILYIALTGALALGMAGQATAADTFEFAGQKYTVSNAPPVQGKIIGQFEIAGEKYILREAIRGDKAAELAVFEVTGGIDEDVYADDDLSIVMTGAR